MAFVRVYKQRSLVNYCWRDSDKKQSSDENLDDKREEKNNR